MLRVPVLTALAAWMMTCKITEPPTPPAAMGVQTLTPTPTAPIADGATPVTLQLHIDDVTRRADPKIVLVTTLGTFTGGTSASTVVANDSGLAYAVLRPPSDTGVASISTTVDGVTKYFSLTFAAAFPDRVQLTTSDFGLKAGAGNAIVVTAQLLRSTGTVSPGVTVTFSADTVGGSAGDFGQFSPRSVISTASVITSRFTAGQTAYRGPIVIRVTGTRNTTFVRDTLVLQVLSP